LQSAGFTFVNFAVLNYGVHQCGASGFADLKGKSFKMRKPGQVLYNDSEGEFRKSKI
jgi:hypothetical protein